MNLLQRIFPFLRPKKEVRIFQWTGDHDQDGEPEWIVRAIEINSVWFTNLGKPEVKMEIRTNGEISIADRGDWIWLNDDDEIVVLKRHDPSQKAIPIKINCPSCAVQHIDENEWKDIPHHQHQCTECGCLFEPMKINTVGVLALP